MKQTYSPKPRRASRILPQMFDLEGATPLGGLNELSRFLREQGLDRELAGLFRETKAPWARWPFDRVVRLLLDLSFAGVARLWHAEDLERDPLLCAQHGVDRLLDFTSLYKELRRFGEAELQSKLRSLLDALTVRELSRQKRTVLEIDSTVEVAYGRQEGAALGPNPHKPGRLSLHPLLARDRITDLVVHQVLRPGNAGTATDIVPFLHHAIDLVQASGPKEEVLARLDSGFESEAVLKLLERRGVGYVVKMRGTAELTHFGASLPASVWHRVEWDGEGEMAVASIFWLRTSWSRERRVVILRKREMEELQGRLFDADGWSYAFFVTDRVWAPQDVARFYDKRADVERTICELKHDLAIDHLSTAHFQANAADLALKVLSRNLLVLYRTHRLRLPARDRIRTIRRRYLQVAGRVVRHAHRLNLRLSVHSPLAQVVGFSP